MLVSTSRVVQFSYDSLIYERIAPVTRRDIARLKGASSAHESKYREARCSRNSNFELSQNIHRISSSRVRTLDIPVFSFTMKPATL